MGRITNKHHEPEHHVIMKTLETQPKCEVILSPRQCKNPVKSQQTEKHELAFDTGWTQHWSSLEVAAAQLGRSFHWNRSTLTTQGNCHKPEVSKCPRPISLHKNCYLSEATFFLIGSPVTWRLNWAKKSRSRSVVFDMGLRDSLVTSSLQKCWFYTMSCGIADHFKLHVASIQYIHCNGMSWAPSQACHVIYLDAPVKVYPFLLRAQLLGTEKSLNFKAGLHEKSNWKWPTMFDCWMVFQCISYIWGNISILPTNVGIAINNHLFLMVGIPPIKMMIRGMVYGIAIPTLTESKALPGCVSDSEKSRLQLRLGTWPTCPTPKPKGQE